MQPLRPHERRNARVHFGFVDGLLHEVVGAGAQSIEKVLVVASRSQDDDRKLGTVGQWVGVVLMILGALRAWQLVQTFLHPPGTIIVDDDEVVLPRGLCMSRPVKVPAKDVTAVYFLRRSVPWNRSAPVLVVELGPRAMAFPRDWFASEADQRHVVHALLRGREDAPAPAKAAQGEPTA